MLIRALTASPYLYPAPRRRKIFLWLHPTKGWKGAVYSPKRGRKRPIPFAQRELDRGYRVQVTA